MDRPKVTKDNVGPVVGISTVMFLAIAVLTTIVRFWARHKFLRRLLLDDYLILASLVFSIGQSVGVWVQVANGFGSRTANLDVEAVQRQLKAEYAEHVLLFASLLCSKLAWLAFLYALTPVAAHKRATVGVGMFICAYGLTAELPGLFQCKPPAPWDWMRQDGSCINRIAWFNYLSAINVATEVSMVVLPVIVIARLETTLARKSIVLAIFFSRLLVIVAVICRWTYLDSDLDSTDQSFNLWPVVICTEAMQALSILTTSLLYITPFLKTFSGGFTRFDNTQGPEQDEELALK